MYRKNFFPEFMTLCNSIAKFIAFERDAPTITCMMGSGLADALNLMEYIGTISYKDGQYSINYLSAWCSHPNIPGAVLGRIILNQNTSKEQINEVYQSINATHRIAQGIRNKASYIAKANREDLAKAVRDSLSSFKSTTRTIYAILDAIDHFCESEAYQEGDMIDEVYQFLSKLITAVDCARIQLFARARFLAGINDTKQKELCRTVEERAGNPALTGRIQLIERDIINAQKSDHIKSEEINNFEVNPGRRYCAVSDAKLFF